jgi:CheY-like chemotaxis protein
MSESRSLLFVDDYDMLRKIYAEIITNAGYRVAEAANADECMESLKRDIPDLILLDIMMKPVDGWETLKRIRSYSPSSEVPVVMISGKAILPSEVIRYGPMIDGFMRKPLQNAVLLSSISEFFSWIEHLKSICDAARDNGIDTGMVASYFSLVRQKHSVQRMLAIINAEYSSSADMMAAQLIADSLKEVEMFAGEINRKIAAIEKETGIENLE